MAAKSEVAQLQPYAQEWDELQTSWTRQRDEAYYEQYRAEGYEAEMQRAQEELEEERTTVRTNAMTIRKQQGQLASVRLTGQKSNDEIAQLTLEVERYEEAAEQEMLDHKYEMDKLSQKHRMDEKKLRSELECLNWRFEECTERNEELEEDHQEDLAIQAELEDKLQKKCEYVEMQEQNIVDLQTALEDADRMALQRSPESDNSRPSAVSEKPSHVATETSGSTEWNVVTTPRERTKPAGTRGSTPPRIPKAGRFSKEDTVTMPTATAQKFEDDDGNDMLTMVKTLLVDKFEEQNKAIHVQRREITQEIQNVSQEARDNYSQLTQAFGHRLDKMENDWWNVQQESEWYKNAGKDMPNAEDYAKAAEENEAKSPTRTKKPAVGTGSHQNGRR